MTIESVLKLSRTLRENNFTFPRLAALALLLSKNGSPIQTNIVAGVLGCSTANTTGLIDSLASSGLVSRTQSTDDRRLVLLTITPAGRKLLEQLVA